MLVFLSSVLWYSFIIGTAVIGLIIGWELLMFWYVTTWNRYR